MSEKIQFLCTRCQKKYPVDHIAFTLPADAIKSISSYLEYRDEDLARRFNNGAELWSCIPSRDLRGLLNNVEKNGTCLTGDLELTMGWLGEKFVPKVQVSNPKEVIYSARLKFEFHQVGETPVAKAILNMKNVPVSQIRMCPHCGKKLCLDTGTAPEVSVILQGSARAGKTACMVSMIAAFLRENRSDGRGICIPALDGSNDEQYSWLREQIHALERCYTVEKTAEIQTEAGAFSIGLRLDGKPLVLTFIDMPGELFNPDADRGVDEKWFEQYGALYQQCDSIWTVMDKLMLWQRSLSREEASLQALTGDTPDLLSRANRDTFEFAFRQIHNIVTSHGFKMPPAALILSKSDIVVDDDVEDNQKFGLFSRFNSPKDIAEEDAKSYQAILRWSGKGNHSFYHEQSAFLRAHLIREYFSQKNNYLTSLFEQNFPLRFYFAMAAYGRKADPLPSGGDDPAQSRPVASPFNVRLPLLWTLAVTGHLKIGYTEEIHVRPRGFLATMFGQRVETRTENRILAFPKVRFGTDAPQNDAAQNPKDEENSAAGGEKSLGISIKNLCMTQKISDKYTSHVSVE